LFSGKTSFLLPPSNHAPAGAHFFPNKLGKIPDKNVSRNHSFSALAGAWNRGYPPSVTYPL
jgi:hypothetical protein